MREEDYATAAEAKAEVDMLRERLPSDKMLLASLLDKLETRLPVSDQERMTAIRQLGDLGDMAAAPALANCLHDGEQAVAAAAENALWAVFMRCVAATAAVSACQAASGLWVRSRDVSAGCPHALSETLFPPLPFPAGAPPPRWSCSCSRAC